MKAGAMTQLGWPSYWDGHSPILADIWIVTHPPSPAPARPMPIKIVLATLAALIQEVFVLMNEDIPATIAWFRTPVPALDWTSPRDLILRGDFPKVQKSHQ